eukprot:COSAG06_NODE_10361_length_1693_cov_1.440476_2_plen_302_part_00
MLYALSLAINCNSRAHARAAACCRSSEQLALPLPSRRAVTRTMVLLTITTLATLVMGTHGLDNGLGSLPGLGWNSDCAPPAGPGPHTRAPPSMPGLPPLLTAAPTAPAPAAAAPAAAPVAARRAGRPLALSAAFGAADCTNCSGPIPVTTSPGTFRSGLRGHGGEAFVKHIADHMHTVKYKTSGSPKTLQELGFRYVNMDASWDTPNRSSTGQLVPDPALWPSGIDHTVAYVHSLDMGFGLYGDRGTMDCARNPGAQGHEEQDGKWFGEHKIDWCACCLMRAHLTYLPPRHPAYLPTSAHA